MLSYFCHTAENLSDCLFTQISPWSQAVVSDVRWSRVAITEAIGGLRVKRDGHMFSDFPWAEDHMTHPGYVHINE